MHTSHFSVPSASKHTGQSELRSGAAAASSSPGALLLPVASA